MSRFTLVAVLVLATLAIGVVIGSLVLPINAPASLATRHEPTEAPVTKVTTDDTQSVNLVFSAAEPQKLVSRGTGLMTSTSCAPGVEAVSGTSAFSINDEPLIYLATSRPVWRDLSIGDTGPDVQALQTELVRLGHSVAVDGKFGSSTLGAAIAMARKAGDDGARSWGSVRAASIVWLPAASVVVVACAAAVGAEVAPGTELAVLPPVLRSATINPLPSQVLAGERVVVAGDLTLPVDADGKISNDTDLVALSRSSAYRALMDGSAGADPSPGGPVAESQEAVGSTAIAMSVVYRLAVPVEVYSVPAAAVYNLVGTHACVQSNGSGVAVTIADSQLGQTLVMPELATSISSVSLERKDALACR